MGKEKKGRSRSMQEAFCLSQIRLFLFQRDREVPVSGCCHHCTERAVGLGGGSAAGTLLPLHVLVRASQSKSFPLGCLVLVVSVYQTNLRLFSSAAHKRKKKSIILEIEAWNGGVPIRSHLNAFTIIIFLIIACFWYIREKSQSP